MHIGHPPVQKRREEGPVVGEPLRIFYLANRLISSTNLWSGSSLAARNLQTKYVLSRRLDEQQTVGMRILCFAKLGIKRSFILMSSSKTHGQSITISIP